jgi:hypothetical protein
MEQVPCVHCGKFFIPRNRRQNYCTEADCQRARKTAWQRYKMKIDVDYRTQQQPILEPSPINLCSLLLTTGFLKVILNVILIGRKQRHAKSNSKRPGYHSSPD